MTNRQHTKRFTVATYIALLVSSLSTFPSASLAQPLREREVLVEPAKKTIAVLWREPTDVRARDLYYGPGGKEHAPHTVYTFVKEDLDGTNPKFDVRDEDGNKWKVKLGAEARPEVVATRVIWAVGYFADEDYWLPELDVERMPRLKRGQEFLNSDGTMHDVRLERSLRGQKKLGSWKWKQNPFLHQREFNGLRVLMALMNSWDVKDANNSILETKGDGNGAEELHYEVSDLGASFGTTGRSWTRTLSKGNLQAYQHSKFIRKVHRESVDFNVPTRPALLYVFTPKEFITRIELGWVGKNIPVADVRWIAGLLGQLSPRQIRDAFRAAGYSSEEVESFAAVVENRIAQLKSI